MLKYLSIFWGTLEMPLINCKIYGAPEENILLLKWVWLFVKYASIELNFETNTVKIKRSLKIIYSNLENFRVNRTIVSSNETY